VTSIIHDGRSISQSTENLLIGTCFASTNKYKGIFRFEYTGFTLAAVDGKKPKDLSSEGM